MRGIVIALALVGSLASPQLRAQDPGGCWTGTIGSGATQRQAVLELRRNGTTYSGELTVFGRTARNRPVAGELTDGAVLALRTTADDSPVQVRASIEADGRALTGSIVSATDSAAFAVRRLESSRPPDQAFAGTWRGVLDAGFPMRIELHFRTAPCGQFYLTMDSPDQGTNDLPATALTLDGDSVRFEMAYIEGGFRGTIERTAGVISGTWMQSGQQIPLRVERSDSAAPGRPQDPRPPFPYRSEEVVYENPTGQVRLAGTLTLPPGAGPHPAVLLVTGSGAQDRDETVAGHRPFLVIADYLTRQGIAVLRVDDRGVGGSTGSVLTSTLADNAGDVLAGVEYLRRRSDIDDRMVGLLGHSEGGYVITLAASRSDDIAFLVMLAGPAVPTHDLLLAQRDALGRAAGEPDLVMEARRTVTGTLLDIARREPDDSVARANMVAAVMDLLENAEGRRREVLDSLYRDRGTESLDVMLTPWFRYLVAYDPAQALRSMRAPLLALYGDLDLQVPARPSADALDRLRTHARTVTVHVFPRLNHLFQTATTGLPAEYIRIEETIAPVVLRTIADWIGEQTRSNSAMRP